MINIIGWIGSFLFAICAVPQAIKTIKEKSAKDFSLSFLIMWGVAEILMITYDVAKLKDLPLLFNYVCNLLCLLPIVYYKIKGFKK